MAISPLKWINIYGGAVEVRKSLAFKFSPPPFPPINDLIVRSEKFMYTTQIMKFMLNLDALSHRFTKLAVSPDFQNSNFGILRTLTPIGSMSLRRRAWRHSHAMTSRSRGVMCDVMKVTLLANLKSVWRLALGHTGWQKIIILDPISQPWDNIPVSMEAKQFPWKQTPRVPVGTCRSVNGRVVSRQTRPQTLLEL